MTLATRRVSRPPIDLLPAEAAPWLMQSLLVFGVALLARGLHFFFMRSIPVYSVLIGDSWQYDRWAQRLAAGDWIGTEVFYQTPLYPYFLGVLYATFGHHVWIVRIAQALLGSVACALLARAGTRFFDQRVGWTAGLLLALYPPAIFFDGILQKAAIDLVLMCALLWTISRYQQAPRSRTLVGLGALLGALILNRENAWVLFPLLVGWSVWCARPKPLSARIRAWIPLVAGMALVLVPVGLRNYYVGGDFLLTTSQMGPNFYIGNHRGANGQYVPLRSDRGDPRFEATDARVLAERDLGRELEPSEVSEYWMRRAQRDIREAPAAWLRLLAWKWFLAWNQCEIVDGEGIRVHAQFSPWLWMLGRIHDFGVLVALAVFGVWFTRHDWRRLWILYAIVLAFALAVTIFYVFARYRYPLVPPVTLFAGAGVVFAWDALRGAGQARRDPWIGGALAGIVAIATCWPLPRLHSDETTYFNVATSLVDADRAAEAIPLFNEAIRLRPDFAEAYNNLGLAFSRTGDGSAAEQAYARSLKIAPRAAAFINLGKLRLDRGDLDGAQQEFQAALRTEPNHVLALQGLAQIELRRGETTLAIQRLRQATATDRKSATVRADLGMAYLAAGDLPEAIGALRSAVDLEPNLTGPANNLAWILATGPDNVRDGSEALRLAKRLCESTQNVQPEFFDTLGAAQAETGDFAAAVRSVDLAARHARAGGRDALLADLAERAKRYSAGQPYRDPALANQTTPKP